MPHSTSGLAASAADLLKSPELRIFLRPLSMDLLDHDTLSVLRDLEGPDDSPSFLYDLIEAFGVETPALLNALDDAIRANEVSSILDHAHQLKGLCGNIGIHRLAAICCVIEENVDKLLLRPESPQLSAIRFLIENTYAASIKELELKWASSP